MVRRPSSWSSTRRATRRRASSRSAVRFASVKNRSRATWRAVRRVDVAVAHPLAERVRAHVDELDLVGAEQDVVREPLVDRRPGDRRDGVGERLEVLDVQRARRRGCRRRGSPRRPASASPAASPARSCGRARRSSATVGRRAMTASVSISSTVDAAVADAAARHDLEPVEEGGRSAAGRASRRSRRRRRCRGRPGGGPPRASGTSCRRPAPCRGRARRRPRLAERRRPSGTARASRRATGGRRSASRSVPVIAASPSRSRLSAQDVDPRLAEEAEQRAPRCGGRRRPRPRRRVDARGPRRPARPGTRRPPG